MFNPAIVANAVVDLAQRGGLIMVPVGLTALCAVAMVGERAVWWVGLWGRRDPARLEGVFAALGEGRGADAEALAAGSRDPVIAMVYGGLQHRKQSLPGALQISAGLVLQQAGRFMGALDTIVTLAPLLGLLGTVTGIMGAFGSLGQGELAVEKVTGGIGEALIATAAGLGIAIGTLIPLNYFHGCLARLQFVLEAAGTQVELLTAGEAAPEA